jgi:hypothetical protein
MNTSLRSVMPDYPVFEIGQTYGSYHLIEVEHINVASYPAPRAETKLIFQEPSGNYYAWYLPLSNTITKIDWDIDGYIRPVTKTQIKQRTGYWQPITPPDQELSRLFDLIEIIDVDQIRHEVMGLWLEDYRATGVGFSLGDERASISIESSTNRFYLCEYLSDSKTWQISVAP